MISEWRLNMKEIDFRHTIVGQGLLWFGAAISIAEIVTGMLFSWLYWGERTRNYSRNSKNIFRTKRNYYIFHI